MELPQNLLSVVYFIRLNNLGDPFERAAYDNWRRVVTEDYIEMWGCQLWFGRFQYIDPVLGDQNPTFGQEIYHLFCERFGFVFPQNPESSQEGLKFWFDYYTVKFGWNRPLEQLLTNYYFLLSCDFGRIPFSRRWSFQLGWLTLWYEFEILLNRAGQENYVDIHIGTNYTYFELFPINVAPASEPASEDVEDGDSSEDSEWSSEPDSEDELGELFNEYFAYARSIGAVQENPEE